MKASLKLRDEPHKPVIKAKLPLHLLGCQFFTGLTVGDLHELALRLGTSQLAGPSFEIAYRPNDHHRSFSLVMKTGFGSSHFSATAALSVAAEFNLSRPGSPSFRLWVKPEAGDFSFRRDFSSAPRSGSDGNHRESMQQDEDPTRSNVGFTNSFARYDAAGDAQENDRLLFVDDRELRESSRNHRIDGDWEHLGEPISSRSSSNTSQQGRHGEEMPLQRPSLSPVPPRSWALHDLLGGVHLRARTCLPISSQAQLKIRWRMDMPPNSSNSPFVFPPLPLLVLDKVSVEAVGPIESVDPLTPFVKTSEKVAQLEAMFFSLKETLHSMQLENNLLKHTMENMRLEREKKNTYLETEPKVTIDQPMVEVEVKQSPFGMHSLN